MSVVALVLVFEHKLVHFPDQPQVRVLVQVQVQLQVQVFACSALLPGSWVESEWWA